MIQRAAVMVGWVLLAGCAQDSGAQDSGAQDSGAQDSGALDSGALDSGAQDSGAQDSGAQDSGAQDSGVQDSGVQDSGVQDSGVQDGGASEPIFVSGADTSAFFDDFQLFTSSSDLATYQSRYPGRWYTENGGPSILLGIDGAARFARAAYTPTLSNILIGAAFSAAATFSAGEEMVVTWDFRVMSGYEWVANSAGGGNKIFLFFDDRLDFIIGSEPLNVAGSIRTWYSGWNARHFTCNTKGNNWQQNLNHAVNPDVITDGAWRRVTWAVRFDNPANAGNGRIRMWIEGIQVMEYDGAIPGRPELGFVTLPPPSAISAFHFPANRNIAPSAGTHTLDYDNVRIFKKGP